MMKKLLLLTIALGGLFTARAETVASGQIGGMDIPTFVEALDKIDGYIFIGADELRDLSLTLQREPNNDFETTDAVKKLDWGSLNPGIASVSDEGMLRGVHFGETLIEASGDGVTNRFLVFVCPRITIVSPEGAIYSYHKVYNQKTRIQFTQSPEYIINNVRRDGVDITDQIDRQSGWYASDIQIDSNTVFWVAMEKAARDSSGDQAVTEGTVKVYVDGHDVTIDAPAEVLSRNIVVRDLWDNVLYSGRWPAGGTLKFASNNSGVFFIDVPSVNTFKIIIHEL